MIIDNNEAEAQQLGVSWTPTFLLIAGGESTELPLTELTADAFTTALESARAGG